MRLKKAIKRETNYPKKENLKPIMLSVTVAMALTACTPNTAGKMPNKESNCSSEPVAINSNPQEVSPPENIAGGMPVYIPDQNATWGNNNKK